MLVNFTVENFGPFKSKTVFTMDAVQSDKEHPGNKVNCDALGKDILTSAAMFGPNASGKTYMIEALINLRNMIMTPSPPGADMRGYVPFRLSPETKNAPVSMSIRFTFENILYDYRISYDSKRIISEHLSYYPNGKVTSVFDRNRDDFRFGRSAGKGQPAIAQMTASNSSFISVAARLNHKICAAVHNWFGNDLILLSNHDEGRLLEIFTTRMNMDPEWKRKAINAMNVADFGIADINGQVRRKKVHELSNIPPQIKGLMMAFGGEETNETELYLLHDVKTEGLTTEDRTFPIGVESDGTIRFLSIIGAILDTLSQGKTLVIDEFGYRLHNQVSEWVIGLFGDPEQNIGKGQLIFNTHNQMLISLDMFRRDQIYFVAKDSDTGESEIFSLSDFGERKDRSVLRGYIDGRYGAMPFITQDKVV